MIGSSNDARAPRVFTPLMQERLEFSPVDAGAPRVSLFDARAPQVFTC